MLCFTLEETEAHEKAHRPEHSPCPAHLIGCHRGVVFNPFFHNFHHGPEDFGIGGFLNEGIPAVSGALTHLSTFLSLLCMQARARPLPPPSQSNQRPCPGPEAPTCGLDAAPAAPGSTRSASTFATWTLSG